MHPNEWVDRGIRNELQIARIMGIAENGLKYGCEG